MDKGLIYKDLSYKIYGLLYRVHNELGCYCNEKQYGDRFEQLLIENKYVYARELVLPPSFIGEKTRNRIDFVIEDKIIIDFKARSIITKDDYLQMKRYLGAYNKKLGLIVNFRYRYLKPRRVLNINASE